MPPAATWQNLDPVRRNRVTEAAMREFGRHGSSAGSNTVAREAGVAKGSLFRLPQLALAPFEPGAGHLPRPLRLPEDELQARALRPVDAVYDGFA